MKIGRGSRRSVRYSVFVGVLAGSVFSGAGAFADLLTQETFYSTISADLSGTYLLGEDIDISRAVRTVDEFGEIVESAPPNSTVFGTFSGTLNGANNRIYGLTTPLFDRIGEGARVENLNLGDSERLVNVSGNGALANALDAGATVNNVNVTGNVTGGTEVGGLVGSSSGTINNSSMNGEVTGSSWKIGGLVGILESTGIITTSNATGDITGFGPDGPSDYIGGLVGWSTGSISSSSATGNVSGRWDVGGLVGYSSGDIANSHATGDVIGRDRVGGLVGQSDGVITFSYAKGEVTSTAINVGGVGYHGELAPDDANGIGGLVGYNTGNITNSFTGEADTGSPIPSGDVTGLKNVGGLVGFSSGDITNSRATGDVNQSWACVGGAPCFEYIGGLVGRSTGDITSSWASGNVGGQDYVGGLVGKSEGDIANSFAAGYVDGYRYVGGLVGYSSGDITIGETYADKPLELDYVSGSEYVGGLVGYSEGNVIDSVSRVPVSGSQDYVGGLVGYLEGDITNSIAEGEVHGSQDYVGGLVGYSEGDITDSSATGHVTGDDIGGPTDYIGGLVGYLEGVIKNSFATGSVSGRDNVGGLVGYLFQGLPLFDEYLNLSTLRSSRPIPNIGEISLVQGDFYIWDGDDWRNIFNISGSYAAEGEVTGRSYVGGLVGSSSSNTTMTDSYATGVVIGDGEYIGGFIGDAGYNSKISNSYATGAVTGTGEFEHGVGGFAGYLSGSLINTYATGNVTGVDEVGGLVGSTGIAANVSITNSYATGNVTGIDYVGGLVGQLDNNHTITGSYARGYVTGDDSVGGLVGSAESGSLISNSYAKGNVTGNDDIGGLVGYLGEDAGVTNSYATGHVIGIVGEDGGDAGGLVGLSYGVISNSHASGDISGLYDVGGLVGDLGSSGSIRNSYATGNVRATGTDGDWSNGWGGLVGESSGLISNSYATGNVVADYNFGSLIGYLMLDESLDSQIVNSFATGSTSSANNDVTLDGGEELFGIGGFVGCAVEDSLEGYSYACLDSYKSFPETTPSILSVVNTVDDGDESGFEIVACKNNGLPLLSELSASYGNTCAPVVPVTTNRERRIREFIQTTSITEIAKTLGFVISPKFPNDAPISFIKSEKDLAISKLLGVQKAADRVARTFVKTGEALQISYDSGGKEPIEIWVKLADGKWILAGVINFDKNGKAVIPPIQFKVAGEYVVALNKPSEDSVKANAPLNQIGALTVIVN